MISVIWPTPPGECRGTSEGWIILQITVCVFFSHVLFYRQGNVKGMSVEIHLQSPAQGPQEIRFDDRSTIEAKHLQSIHDWGAVKRTGQKNTSLSRSPRSSKGGGYRTPQPKFKGPSSGKPLLAYCAHTARLALGRPKGRASSATSIDYTQLATYTKREHKGTPRGHLKLTKIIRTWGHPQQIRVVPSL